MKNQYPLAVIIPDTFDSYFGQLFFHKESLVIPYINFGIADHTLNPSSNLKFIDRSYIVLSDIKFLLLNNGKALIDKDRKLSSFYFGGHDLIGSQNVVDIEVKSAVAFLQLLPDSIVSEHKWRPIDTPNSKASMKEEIVTRFIRGYDMPDNIMELLKQ